MEEEKRKERRKQNLVYGICGLLLMLVLLPIALRRERQADLQAEVLFLGDSILGQYRDETSIPSQAARLMDVSVFNGNFGGTTMSLPST